MGSYDKFISPRLHPVWNFDRWFDEAESEGFFAEYDEWGVDKDEVAQRYREATGKLPAGYDYEIFEREFFKKKAWRYVHTRLLELDDEFSTLESDSDGVKVYRHLIVKDGAAFLESVKKGGLGADKRKGVGECWSWCRVSAYSHCSDIAPELGDHVTLTGSIKWEDVEMDATIWNNFNPNWAEERELKLHVGSPIRVTEIEINGKTHMLDMLMPA